jgi:mRNA deadenylase 3'-5' endonuclease subunit Ccr4
MAITIVSCNVLANSYIRPEWYPRTPARVLDWSRRRPALVEHVAAQSADVICLQEVEADLFDALEERLAPLGYAGRYLQKAGKPDGCATFFRSNRCEWRAEHHWYYRDGRGSQPDSGHLALVVKLHGDGLPLFIGNTHIKWDRPGTPSAAQWGLRQTADFLERKSELDAEAGWIVCGDFNASADSGVLRLFRDAGFVDAYAGKPTAYTCVSNGRAKRIDFLLHSQNLASQSHEIPPLTDDTPLPSWGQPSDHLVIRASVSWRTPFPEGR